MTRPRLTHQPRPLRRLRVAGERRTNWPLTVLVGVSIAAAVWFVPYALDALLIGGAIALVAVAIWGIITTEVRE